MATYVKAAEDEDGESIEVPTEDDGCILLSTLSAQFPQVTGLKYRDPTSGGMRAVRLVEGRFHPPNDEGGGWGKHVYFCVLPKDQNKRKSNSDNSSVTKMARMDNARNKCSDLIVLGLTWRTDEDQLRASFEPFGELLMAQVKKDVRTGQSKGFGFVRFANIESQNKVLSQRHMIDGRWCDVKIPYSKETQPPGPVPTKVFVGRCTEDISAEDLKQHFGQFGQVTDAYIPKPFRAFAFVTFLEASAAQKLYGKVHVVKGVTVHVSTVTPKSSNHRRY